MFSLTFDPGSVCFQCLKHDTAVFFHLQQPHTLQPVWFRSGTQLFWVHLPCTGFLQDLTPPKLLTQQLLQLQPGVNAEVKSHCSTPTLIHDWSGGDLGNKTGQFQWIQHAVWPITALSEPADGALNTLKMFHFKGDLEPGNRRRTTNTVLFHTKTLFIWFVTWEAERLLGTLDLHQHIWATPTRSVPANQRLRHCPQTCNNNNKQNRKFYLNQSL